MAETQTLHDAFLDELKDAYDAEKQLVKALPKLAKASTSPELRQAFEDHLEETNGHVEKLEQVFESLDEKAKGKHCDGMAGIIDEGKNAMGEDYESATLDAVLIASAQRAEHYEMAAYGTMVAWARAMGHNDAAELLQEILDEEKAADEKLNAIAESGVNEQAASGMESDNEEDEGEEEADNNMAARGGRRNATAAASIARRSPRKRK
jgi:ferritin-like metal-binding protein YciE